MRAEQQERSVGFLRDDRVREHPALAVEPERVRQGDIPEVRRALPLQEGRRVLARHPDDRGVSWSDAPGHQSAAQSQAMPCNAKLA